MAQRKRVVLKKLWPELRVEQFMSMIAELVSLRGYFVIGVKPGREKDYWAGQIIHQVADFSTDIPWRVMQPTTVKDWLEQVEVVRKLSPVAPRDYVYDPELNKFANKGTFWRVVVAD